MPSLLQRLIRNFSVPVKGVVLVCLPLIFELALILTMSNLLSQAEADAALAMRSAKVIEIGHRLVEIAFAAESGCQGYAFTGNPLYKDMYKRAHDEFPEVLARLQNEQASSEEQESAEKRIQHLGKRYLKILERDMSPTGIKQEENSLSAEVLNMLQNRIEDFLGEEEEIQQKRYSAQSHARQELNHFVFIAVGCNVMMAIVLALFFSASITRRLRILIENTNLLSSGKPLNSPVGGQDEITHLDRVFHEMASTLRRAEQEKLEFVAMVGHDLRVPLNAIQLFLQALQAGLFGETSERLSAHATGAEQNAERIQKLIKDLLEIERLESGIVDLHLRAVELDGLIDSCIEGVRLSASKREISINRADKNYISAKIDEDRIAQVLTNILSNAIKFAPESSCITVTCRHENDSVEIEVSDEGRGIPLALQQEIFERFKQTQITDASELKGAGLGLAICKKLIDLHHGTIGVRSEVGHGSSFWFRLPLHEVKAPTSADDTRALALLPGKGDQ